MFGAEGSSANAMAGNTSVMILPGQSDFDVGGELLHHLSGFECMPRRGRGVRVLSVSLSPRLEPGSRLSLEDVLFGVHEDRFLDLFKKPD